MTMLLSLLTFLSLHFASVITVTSSLAQGPLEGGGLPSQRSTENIVPSPVIEDQVHDGQILRYNFSFNDVGASKGIRVTASSKQATLNYPVLFVVRQQKSVLSWSVPYVIQSTYTYQEVSHTLCPENGFTSSPTQNVTVEVATSSTESVDFVLLVESIDKFNLRTNEPKTFTVSPSKPEYYTYSFSQGVESMIVKATSSSDICTVVSVQPAQCPVYDQHGNVEFVGQYQTITKQAAITVQRSYYPDGNFFVVVVVQPTDSDCSGNAVPYVPLINMTSRSLTEKNTNRSKTITITVTETLPSTEYWRPILATIGVLLTFYVVTGILMCVFHKSDSGSDGRLEEQVPILPVDEDGCNNMPFAASTDASTNYGTAAGKADQAGSSDAHRRMQQLPENGYDSNEDDIDMLDDIHEEKEIYRTKMGICVADLSRKKVKTLDRKYKLYYWNLVTIAVFYALPVVQLVITYQAVLNKSGDEDLCYYNFLCAMPGGLLSAFNNVFSNIGYVMLGFLYLLIVWRKHHLHKKAVAADYHHAKMCGIPKHFGLFYSLGIALVMEGVLSGSYHVCPNYSNFQFDTAFMYIIAGLGMLVLYQQRHPDINANAYAAFATFASVIFIALMGVIFVSVYFYVLFAVVHILTCLAVSAQIYYMGTWKLDFGIFKRVLFILRTECSKSAKPLYLDRMIVLITGNAVNWSIMIYGLAKMPRDFNSFLLAIFLVNLLLYLAFYIIMKVRSGEKLTAVVIVIIVVTLVVWGFALYFYSMSLTGWEKTAAASRESNAACLLFDFYDGHDIWHFLSSGALFFSFLLLLVMDNDLDGKDRTKIAVF
ncbi:SID1 transmembrane family member 1-like isoform X1 [Asterias rubens]|uniref:SID1 transmembrane family member 1-like isoform X1 n=1 Tax=Asterias rubens TaxID=7604 RepID=UPI0014551630|nr:SID1 transmembrane family member 1-like isoform X1 [Asterias rubens]